MNMCVSSSSRSTKPAPALLSSSRSQCMPCLSCRTPTIIISTEGSITMNSRTVAEEIKRVWTSGRQSLARSRSQQVERSLWQQNRRNSRNTAEIVEIAQTVELAELAELGDEETATADARVETWATSRFVTLASVTNNYALRYCAGCLWPCAGIQKRGLNANFIIRTRDLFMASRYSSHTRPYEVLANASWRFLRRLDVEAGRDTPIVLAWGGAKTHAARHLRGPHVGHGENQQQHQHQQ